jgi:hypothetical protein
MVAAGLEAELVKWNLVLVVPLSQCVLTIPNTAGGLVTTLVERTFTYVAKTVIDLVAEPEGGHLFVNWTGNVGIKAGDWMRVEYTNTALPAGLPYPEWLKFEFLSVEGTNATTRVTMHKSDGTEQSDTVPVDLKTGGGEAFGLSEFVIPANLTIGDSIYIIGYGDVVIEGETTRTYAGARRTVVYASFSQWTSFYEFQFNYYWDKLTGVIVEASITFPGGTVTAKVIETNIWEATTIWMQWWLWVIIAAVIVTLALAVVYLLKNRKTPTAPT